MALSHLLRLLACCAVALLAACSKDIPHFAPPDQRPLHVSEQAWPANHFITLAYHDVEDVDADQTFLSVRTDRLLVQLAWLREHGYTAVSVDQILAARAGGPPLPPRAVLLSFDDGYSSFYERVFPVLKAYGWPAILAPVGRWADTPPGQPVDFGGLAVARERFLSWDQIRELGQSPLVELAAHTDNLHFGHRANPQGNTLPAAASLQYDATRGRYETADAYEARLRADVRAISGKLERAWGQPVRVWVWPYGAAHGVGVRVLDDAGYRMALTLQDGAAHMDNLMHSPRFLLSNDPDPAQFAQAVQHIPSPGTMRVMHVDLDYLYDPDPEQVNQNLGALVQRVRDMGITHVFLQAYADEQGDGLARALYFPNRWLPMRADLFNRVAWQLRNRAFVEIYAWMPVLSFDLDSALPRVQAWQPETGTTAPQSGQYARLSPFDPEVRRRIGDLYEDLAWQASIDGILFHDDALLSDFEDAGPAALAAYRQAGLPGSIAELREDPATLHAWTRFKSRYLIDFTHELAARTRAVRGQHILTARNIFAQPILAPESETWFAQNLGDFLAAYDWTAPMAMPYMEQVPPGEERRWLQRLVEAVARHPGALSRTVFELQAVDWRKPAGQHHIPAETLADWMRTVQRAGARNFGYYPDDYVADAPRLDVVRPAFSREWYPLHD